MPIDIQCNKKIPQKTGKNSVKGAVNPRTWKAVSDVVKKADVHSYEVDGKKNNVVLSIVKQTDKDGKPINRFHLVPNWRIMYQGVRVQKDLLDFLTIIKDTLIAENPVVRIDYRCGKNVVTVRGRIIGFVGTKGDDSLYHKHKNSHNCHMYIKLNKGQKLPDTLTNFQITVTGQLLPKSRYKYGFCNVASARFRNCSDLDYIKNTGSIGWSYGIGRCQVFDLYKDNPKHYCSMRTGN